MNHEKGYVTGPNWVHISTIPLKLADMKKMSNQEKHSSKWHSCVNDVTKKGTAESPEAVCTASLGDQSFESEAKHLEPGPGTHSDKWDRCVQHVKDKSGDAYNAYAVCTAALGASSFNQSEAISGTSQVAQLRGKKKESDVTLHNKKLFKFRETSTDNYKQHLFKVCLIKEGLGNFKDRFFYSKEALRSAAERNLFNGIQAFADHPSMIEEEVRPERSTEDIIGYYDNITYEENENGQGQLMADLLVPTTVSKDWVLALLTNSVDYSTKFKERDLVGLSINASGPAESMDLEKFMSQQNLPEPVLIKLIDAKAQGITEINLVNELTEVTSVDLVTRAGAGGRIQRMVEGGIKHGKAKSPIQRKRRRKAS